MLTLLAIVLFALGISFFCSILEAALLSISIPVLIEQKKKGHKGSGLLLDIKMNRIDDAISAILTLNTFANTIGATLAGWQAANVFGDAMVGVFSFILTFLIFIFSEIIPKTLGNVHASRLSPYVGHICKVMIISMKPILMLTALLTRMISRGAKNRVSIGELSALVTLAEKEKTITKNMSRIFNQLLQSKDVDIEDIMTPRTVVAMVDGAMTTEDFLKHKDAQVFSRLPVYEGNKDEVTGYILVRQLMAACLQGQEDSELVRNFVRPIQFLPRQYSLGSALAFFTKEREHLAMVVDEYGSILGLVTLEDLVETLLGIQIIDEFDEVPDLRAVAVQLRDKRMVRIKARMAASFNAKNEAE